MQRHRGRRTGYCSRLARRGKLRLEAVQKEARNLKGPCHCPHTIPVITMPVINKCAERRLPGSSLRLIRHQAAVDVEGLAGNVAGPGRG